MPKHATSPRQATDEPQQSAPAAGRYRVDHYGKSRNFAAYDGQDIIAVTLYRKGAAEVTRRLTEQDRRIADLEHQLADARRQQAPAPPPPPAAAPAPAWRPPVQLALIAAEDLAPYRITAPRRRLPTVPRRP